MDIDEPTTRPSLLLRIRDARDKEAWSQFVQVYTPIVYRYVRRHGLQDADAADVTQDVLRTVVRWADRLSGDRPRGSFRSWLLTVTRSRLSDHFDRLKRQPLGSGDSDVEETLNRQPAREVGTEEEWEREYRWSLFDWAARQVRGEFRATTWEAFWQATVLGRESKAVARELGMSVGALYIARSRVLARIKQQIAQIEE